MKRQLLAAWLGSSLAAVVMAVGALPARAAEYWLRAEALSVTMPDGRPVPMWGFALDADHDFNTIDGAPSVPGPPLVVPPGEGLTVHLFNNGLPENVSLVISGQVFPTDGVNPAQPVRNPDGRVRSFVHETAPGAAGDYVWDSLRPGTSLYTSGSHAAVQVQMGLYGALLHDAAAGDAYGEAGTSYDQDLALIFSEIDPALHDAVAAGQYGPGLAVTSTMEYVPQYFLINGAPFSPGRSPLPFGPEGSRTLLRFINAGLKTRQPVIPGLDMSFLAEDAHFRDNPAGGSTTVLPAGKTVDAMAVVPAAGYYPVFDRALGLTNGTLPGGGMLAYLQVEAPVLYTLTVSSIGAGTGRVVAASLPGGIDCGTDCAETYNAGTQVRLSAIPDPGSLLRRWIGGGCGTGTDDCVVTMAADTLITAQYRFFNVVQLISPSGGDVLQGGGFHTIVWGAPASAKYFKLHYSVNGGQTWRLIDRGIEGWSYVWEVPPLSFNRPNSRIRIRAYDADGVLLGSDTSALFTINRAVP